MGVIQLVGPQDGFEHGNEQIFIDYFQPSGSVMSRLSVLAILQKPTRREYEKQTRR